MFERFSPEGNAELMRLTGGATSYIDNDIESGGVYFYILGVTDRGGLTTMSNPIRVLTPVFVNGENIVSEFSLKQNYPNPFNPATVIEFSIPTESKVGLKIYDLLGREIAELVNSELQPGLHKISFNGEKLSSGVYYYKLTAGEFSDIKKLILVK
jgi:hypothetical protein